MKEVKFSRKLLDVPKPKKNPYYVDDFKAKKSYNPKPQNKGNNFW